MNIPILSQRFFSPRMMQAAANTAPALLAMFAAADKSSNGEDPSNCRWFANFVGGAIAWSAKLAIDADGSRAGRGFRDGEQLDPADGQDSTSLRFADGSPLTSEGVPWYVMPGGGFAAATGLELGDVGIVVLGDVIAAAILGDIGPMHKLGEGSIALHNDLRPAAPDPCRERDGEGRCVRIRDVSIPGDVIALFFRGSKILIQSEDTARAQIRARAYGLFTAIGGILPTPEKAINAETQSSQSSEKGAAA